VLDTNDDINFDGHDYCSSITATLIPGTYYLWVYAYTDIGASGLPGRGYAVSVRQGL
jgi:hypothetical protein